MLTAYLDHYRETFALMCAGVAAQRLSGSTWPMIYYSDDDPDQDFVGVAGRMLNAREGSSTVLLTWTATAPHDH